MKTLKKGYYVMTKTISINAGSSSLKWQLYLMPEEKVLAKGLIERIGLKDSISTVKFIYFRSYFMELIKSKMFRMLRAKASYLALLTF